MLKRCDDSGERVAHAVAEALFDFQGYNPKYKKKKEKELDNLYSDGVEEKLNELPGEGNSTSAPGNIPSNYRVDEKQECIKEIEIAIENTSAIEDTLHSNVLKNVLPTSSLLNVDEVKVKTPRLSFSKRKTIQEKGLMEETKAYSDGYHQNVKVSKAPNPKVSIPKPQNARARLSSSEQWQSDGDYDFAILLKAAKQEEVVDEIQIQGKRNMKNFYKNNPESAKNYVINSLRCVGLEIRRLRSLDGKQTLIKVKAPQDLLELGAEQMRMKKQRKEDHTWTEFTRSSQHIFEEYDKKNGTKFIDSERQNIVYYLITSSNGAGLNEYSEVAGVIDEMFPLHKANLEALRNNWVYFWRKSVPYSDGYSTSLNFPLASSSRIKKLCCHALVQPIDEIAKYYGEKIAFYFAWMEMYTRWLIIPSIAGCGLFFVQVSRRSLDQPLAPFYAILMALWASAFLIAWQRKANELAYRWGTLGYEEEETTRPEFQGDPCYSTATEKRYPLWKRLLKYCITLPIVMLAVASISALMYIVFRTKDDLEKESVVSTENTTMESINWSNLDLNSLGELARLAKIQFWVYLFLTPILYGFLIPLCDSGFTRLAKSLNEWENHKTDTMYQSHLIIKVFSFRFVHVFASLYYYAFASGSNLLRVAIQLASFMITGQIWNNVLKCGVPLLRRKYRNWKRNKATELQIAQSEVFTSDPRILRGGGKYDHNDLIREQCKRLEQATATAWEESMLEKFDTFEEYAEILIQFGYVSFFSIAFPLAPLLALLNNLVELRLGAFKLCFTKQRPLARRASGIGIWFTVLQLMSAVAVITNCIHIAFTTTQIQQFFPFLSASGKVWVVLIVEHIIFALKIWITYAIPSMPLSVKESLRIEKEHIKLESAKAAILIKNNKNHLVTDTDSEDDNCV